MTMTASGDQQQQQQGQQDFNPQPPGSEGLPKSIFVDDDAEVYDVPVSVIRRPLASSLDEAKVCNFVEHIKAGAKLTPIEVAWVERPEGSYYFAFGGCHRWEAHKRLGSQTIPAKLIKVPPSTINVYMGASSPFRNIKG